MTTKFQKGKSGNPKGKPPGTKDSRTELRQLLQPHAKDLLQKAVDMALDGDPQALRMCIDRLVPSLKATSEPVPTQLPTGGSLADQAQAIYLAATAGQIGTDEATALMSLVQSQCRIKGLIEIEERLRTLETQAEVSNVKFRR